MNVIVWIAIGIIGIGYLIWKIRTSGREKEEMNFKEKVVSFFLTPRKTVEKEETEEEFEGSAFEYEGGIYKMKSYVLSNGNKLSLHSKENPVPHGDETDNATKKIARSNFISGSLDNLTTVDRGGTWNIGKYLRMIPGEVYFLLLVLLVILI